MSISYVDRLLSGYQTRGLYLYMDAPFAKLSVREGLKVSIAPVHPDFRCGRAAVPDGICWSDPNCFLALEVPQTFWALPTTV